MKLKTRYQIFISSTFIDLKEERQKIIETILRLEHFPIGMELFHADDQNQWRQIKQAIDDSDFYILIIAHRYGSLTSRNISYTEKEYNYAKLKKKPIYAFIISDEVNVNIKYIDQGFKAEKLLAFKTKIKKSQCSFWHNKEELAYEVSQTLINAVNNYNRLGWIKIDNDIDLKNPNGIEEYFYTTLSRMKEILKEGTYIEKFERYIDLEFIEKNKLKVSILTNVIYKNIKKDKLYYNPQPVFQCGEERDSYKNLVFEINGNDELKNIVIKKINRSKTKQLPYGIINEINYNHYSNSDDLYIKHKTEYIKNNDQFFLFYQVKYPCKKLIVHCNLLNKKDKYTFVCSSSSSYMSIKDTHTGEIEKDESRVNVIFGEWSDVGDGFTNTLSKK